MRRYFCEMVFAAFVLVVCGCIARADTYADGYYEDGYTYHAGDGYWWRLEEPYTRVKVTRYGQGYYQYGVYYPGQAYYHWQYTRIPQIAKYDTAPAYVPPKVPAYTSDWKVQVLKYAEYRDDLQAYHLALAALGIQGQTYGFQQATYRTGYNLVPYGGYGSTTLGSYGANGNTQYGYSYATVKDVYGSTDLNVLYQQAARLTQNAQQLSGQATTDFSDLVGQEGGNRARVAEILAKGQAARLALDGATLPPSTRTETRMFQFQIVPGTGDLPAQLVPGNAETLEMSRGNAGFAQWQQSAGRCVKCHSGAAPSGGFDVSRYWSLPPDRQNVVWERLTSTDPAKLMPRNGTVGVRLPEAELKLWRVMGK